MGNFFQGSVLLAQGASFSLHGVGHIHLFPSKVYKNGTDACGAIDATGEPLPLSEQTRPSGQPAMCVSGSLSECMVLGAGVHR